MTLVSAAEPVRRQPPSPAIEPCSLPQLLGYFLRLGAFGFGGSIALCGYMQRDLVEQGGWIEPEDTSTGWPWRSSPRDHSPRSSRSTSVGFAGGSGRDAGRAGVHLTVVPHGARPVCALRAVGWALLDPGAFYGIGAAVIAIISRSVWSTRTNAGGHEWLASRPAMGRSATPGNLPHPGRGDSLAFAVSVGARRHRRAGTELARHRVGAVTAQVEVAQEF